MDKLRLQKLKFICAGTLAGFEYITDLEQYGKIEKWEVIPKSHKLGVKFKGDCEAFALTCRKLCRDAGFTKTRLVVCYTELGEGHCILEVNGYVMDNRMTKLVTKKHLEKVGYEWLGISGYNPGDKWTKVK